MTLAAGVVVVGCGGSTSEKGGALCQGFADKLTQCGFTKTAAAVSAGACEEPTGSEEVCGANCFLAQSCGSFDGLYCQGNPGSLLGCVTKCEGPPFKCATGDEVSASSKCDGFEDCADGSDETGCPTFECADGQEVGELAECDGYPDCADGSDEAGCAKFKCANGSEVVESAKCDDYEDCADGSDEVGCPNTGPSFDDAVGQDCQAKGFPPPSGGGSGP